MKKGEIVVLILGVLIVATMCGVAICMITSKKEDSKVQSEIQSYEKEIGVAVEDKESENVVSNAMEEKNVAVENENELLEKNVAVENKIDGDVNITYVTKPAINGTLTLPQIKDNTEGAKSINAKIDKIYSINQIYGVDNTVVLSNMKYKNENLIGISLWLRGKHSGGITYCFYYNVDTKKEFTLKDIIESEGFTLKDINEKYQKSLDSFAASWGGEKNIINGREYTITGEEMFYTDNKYLEEVGRYTNVINIMIPIDKAYCLENEYVYTIRFEYKNIGERLEF